MSMPLPASGVTPAVATTVPANAMADNGSATGSATTSGGSPISVLFIEIAGVIILALIAGVGPRIGKIVAIFMAGLMVFWAITHAATLAKLLPGSNQNA